ncbi:MAG: hypothetical protein OEW97_09415 [Gammaproteobacteria bacterium]|nr:hypothetical protein [Gammaproteobacteria bacterium]
MYTSNTPEASEGKWSWLRFSAAASPGNSGGPLLDNQGNVIGVILRKSESENLNYALPMSEILKFADVAELYSKSLIYKIDITSDTSSISYDKKFNLPMDVKEIDHLLQKEMHNIFEMAASDFLKKHKKRMFPNDNGSLPVLYNRYTASFPSILMKGNDDIWDIFKPKDIKSADTGNGGYVRYGKMGSFYYLKVKRPDNVDAKKYYFNAKMVMDQVLKGINFHRNIGSESISITSLGESIESRLHVDNFGRKWQVNKWLVGFGDQKFVLYALPTPDGYVVMLSIVSTAHSDMMEIDMKIITNNLYYTYYGTLADWSTFLPEKDITPKFINTISINTDKKSFIEYKDNNFNFRVSDNTMKITKDSDIQLRCSYYKEDGKVIWAPVMVVFGENKNISNYASVSRNFNPPESLEDSYRKRWMSIINKRTPYDAKPYNENQMTNITMLRANNLNALKKNNVIYALSWHEEGVIDNAVMKQKLNALNTDFKYQD